MIRIGLIFPLFCLATLTLLIPRYVSTSELEQESVIYEDITVSSNINLYIWIFWVLFTKN